MSEKYKKIAWLEITLKNYLFYFLRSVDVVQFLFSAVGLKICAIIASIKKLISKKKRKKHKIVLLAKTQ